MIPHVFDVSVGFTQACYQQSETTAIISIFKMKTGEKFSQSPKTVNNSKAQTCGFNLLSCWYHRMYLVTWLCSRLDVKNINKAVHRPKAWEHAHIFTQFGFDKSCEIHMIQLTSEVRINFGYVKLSYEDN